MKNTISLLSATLAGFMFFWLAGNSLARPRLEQHNRIYMAALEKVARDMNYIMPPKVHSCLERAVSRTPFIVKETAYRLKSVDINILEANGVPKEELVKAVKIVEPCLQMLGIIIPR